MRNKKPKKVWLDLAEGNLQFILGGFLVLAVAFGFAQAANTLIYAFDFGTIAPNTTQSGYLRITGANVYNAISGYGWLQSDLSEEDNPEVANFLERDMNGSSATKEFKIDLADGFYRLGFVSGGLNFKYTTVIKAEVDFGTTIVSETSQWVRRNLDIEVTDGQLNLTFSSVAGANWAINALTVTSIDAPLASGTLAINPQNVNLGVGDKVTLIANRAGVSWASDNLAVATVNGLGLVTAVGAGQATITATLGALLATSSINVAAREVIDDFPDQTPPTVIDEDGVDETPQTVDDDQLVGADDLQTIATEQTFVARVIDNLFASALKSGTIQTAGDYPFEPIYEENQPNNFWGSIFGFVGVAH